MFATNLSSIHTDLVEFGKEGEIPILTYFDTREMPIKYFSFASWTGVEAKFLYDCPSKYQNGKLIANINN